MGKTKYLNSLNYSYQNIQANRIYHDYIFEEYERSLQVRFGVWHPNCGKRLEWLKDRYSIKKGNLVILNLGAGTGNLIKKSEEIFGYTIALDISRNMLQKAKRYTNRLIQGNAVQIPLKSQSLNIVFCIALLHHIYDLEGFFRSVYEALRPGGIFYSDYDLNRGFSNSVAKFYPLRLLFFLYKKLNYPFKHKRDYQRLKIIHDLAEYHEEFYRGLKPEEVADIAQKAGFSKVDWICHSDSPNLDYPRRGRLIHKISELLLLPFSKDYAKRAKIFSIIAIK